MGALDAFNAIWGQTRATFGEGVPVDGSGYDKSPQFRDLQSQTQSAAPGSHWTGSASDAYADANDARARKFGRMAELDQKMGVEITRSADAVLAGRRQLDAVRQWVNDAAAGLPKTAAGDAQLFSVVSKGSSEISEIIRRTHNEMASIAGRVDILKAGWDELGGDPKDKGPGDKDGIDKLTGEKDDDARRRAE
ncbi:EspA/EspE family type VII secretion system effector [Mycobacterium sp. SMC-16]